MEAPVHRDDLVGAVAMAGAPPPRELDRAFVGLGAAVAEKDLIEAGRIGQQTGQLRHRLVVVRGAAVDQPGPLRAQRIEHHAGRVAERVHRPALDEVEIALAVAVPEPRARAPDHHGRRPLGDLHDVVELFVHDTLL